MPSSKNIELGTEWTLYVRYLTTMGLASPVHSRVLRNCPNTVVFGHIDLSRAWACTGTRSPIGPQNLPLHLGQVGALWVAHEVPTLLWIEVLWPNLSTGLANVILETTLL